MNISNQTKHSHEKIIKKDTLIFELNYEEKTACVVKRINQ